MVDARAACQCYYRAEIVIRLQQHSQAKIGNYILAS